ncbi:hypothetical protein U1Q18_004497 [Sarracenia purpurea var. burkii]
MVIEDPKETEEKTAIECDGVLICLKNFCSEIAGSTEMGGCFEIVRDGSESDEFVEPSLAEAWGLSVMLVDGEDELEIRMDGVGSRFEGKNLFEMDWSGIWAYGGEDRGGGMD